MTITAKVNYHVKSEATQSFLFDVDGKKGNIIPPELRSAQVQVKDVRDHPALLDFDRDGIIFVQSPSQIRRFDNTALWRESYDQEIEALLKQHIDAKDVLIFDHTIRINDSKSERKPAFNVHNDYSRTGAEKRLTELIPIDCLNDYLKGNYGFVNIWRPIENKIQSSPLGFIKPDSMDTEDWININLVYPNRFGQILGAAYSHRHEWFYQSEMTPDEIAIFNTYDNRDRPILAHSALELASAPLNPLPRKSIETRTLVRYD